MSVCPWCKAEMVDANSACRRCGRQPFDHPSIVQGGGRTIDPWDDDTDQSLAVADRDPSGLAAVPDLELNRGPVRQANVQAASNPPSPQAVPTREVIGNVPDVHVGGGQVFDEDDAFGPAPGAPLALELDVQPGARSGRAGALAPAGPPSPRPSRIGTKVVTPIPPPAGARASFVPVAAGIAERNTAAQAAIDFEAQMLAKFGEPPSNLLKAPLYAYRVWTRLKELRAQLVFRTQEAERTARVAEDALVALGQRARIIAEKDPGYGRTMEGLRNAEAVLRSRDGALMAEMDAHNKKLLAMDKHINDLEAELGVARNEERRIADELEGKQNALQRAETKVRRLEQELRGLQPQGPK
jgi:hypothetical protein